MLVDINNNNKENTGAGTSAALAGSSYINRIIANKKGPKLWYGNNLFRLRKKPDVSKGIKFAYWNCTVGACKVSCKTKDVNTLDEFEFGSCTVHLHDGFTTGGLIRDEMIKKGRVQARDYTKSIGKILDDLEAEYLNQENFTSVKWKRDNVKQILQRERRSTYPKIPKTLEEYDSSKGQATLDNGDRIVLFDANSSVKVGGRFEKIRVVAFATKIGLEMLGKGKKWYVDGTFKAVPTIFTQLVTFHTKYLGWHWPCVHCLCSSKSKESYSLMYVNLKISFGAVGLVPRPRSFNVDFELAHILAIRIHYPNSSIHGCYFHFCQAIYRKVQEFGLAPAFCSRPVFHLWVKKILACPYLPLEVMEDYFIEEILIFASNNDDIRDMPGIDDFCDYVTSQWFENPSVPQSLWNIHDREDDDRTNNCCETWHSKWNRKDGTQHPHVFKFEAQLCVYHQALSLRIYQAENNLLPVQQLSKYQMTMNDTISAKKQLLADGKITVSQYIGQANFWCCKSNSQKLAKIFAGVSRSKSIEELEKSEE